jgi:hypothetical protein
MRGARRSVSILILVGGRFFGLFLFLEGCAGGLFADLARIVVLGTLDLLGRRFLGQHRVEIEDLAQLHRPFVERVGPADDRVEGDRRFAQAQDHRVPAGLDPLGDGDLALAAQQLDRAHLAQIHAHGIVGAIHGFFFLGGFKRGFVVLALGIDFVRSVVLGLIVLADIFIFDDVDAHVTERRHDVFDLFGGELVLRQHLIELVHSDVAALLRAGHQLLDGAFVEIDQRRVTGFRGFRTVCHICLSHRLPLKSYGGYYTPP